MNECNAPQLIWPESRVPVLVNGVAVHPMPQSGYRLRVAPLTLQSCKRFNHDFGWLETKSLGETVHELRDTLLPIAAFRAAGLAKGHPFPNGCAKCQRSMRPVGSLLVESLQENAWAAAQSSDLAGTSMAGTVADSPLDALEDATAMLREHSGQDHIKITPLECSRSTLAQRIERMQAHWGQMCADFQSVPGADYIPRAVVTVTLESPLLLGIQSTGSLNPLATNPNLRLLHETTALASDEDWGDVLGFIDVDMVVAAGSSFAYEWRGDREGLVEFARELEATGVGRGRRAGWGKVRVCDPIHLVDIQVASEGISHPKNSPAAPSTLTAPVPKPPDVRPPRPSAPEDVWTAVLNEDNLVELLQALNPNLMDAEQWSARWGDGVATAEMMEASIMIPPSFIVWRDRWSYERDVSAPLANEGWMVANAPLRWSKRGDGLYDVLMLIGAAALRQMADQGSETVKGLPWQKIPGAGSVSLLALAVDFDELGIDPLPWFLNGRWVHVHGVLRGMLLAPMPMPSQDESQEEADGLRLALYQSRGDLFDAAAAWN